MPVVLITGCSEGGIGYALAKEYANRGCQVIATARNPARMGGLEQLGCRLLPLDVADPASVRRLADTVAAEYGAVDVLVNNAGGAARGPVLDSPVEEAEALFQANYFGAVRLTVALLPGMIQQRSGVVVNVGSVAGYWATPFQSHYSASKAALAAFSDALRLEVAPFGLRVMHAAPGFVATEIFNKASGRIFCNKDGPYGPLKEDIAGDIFEREGRWAIPAEAFARRFAAASLKARPPAVFLDGRWGWSVPLAAWYAPRWAMDLWGWAFFRLWELSPWWGRLMAAMGRGQEWVGDNAAKQATTAADTVGAAAETAIRGVSQVPSLATATGIHKRPAPTAAAAGAPAGVY